MAVLTRAALARLGALATGKLFRGLLRRGQGCRLFAFRQRRLLPLSERDQELLGIESRRFVAENAAQEGILRSLAAAFLEGHVVSVGLRSAAFHAVFKLDFEDFLQDAL